MMQQSKKKDAGYTLTLSDNKTGKSFELPVLASTLGPSVIDVRRLYAETGMFTYDPGFTSTGSAESAITYIDGENGILLHRGYSIEELAEHSNFLEVCYLLLYGDLPNVDQSKKFTHDVTYHSMLNEQVTYFLRGFRRDAHPMAIMIGVVGALSAFYHVNIDITDPKQRVVTEHRLLAKMPTIAAMAYKYSIGQPFIYPRNDLTYAENFLHMMFAVPAEEYDRILSYFGPPNYEVSGLQPNTLQSQKADNADFSRWCSTNLAEHKQPGYSIITISFHFAGFLESLIIVS